MPAQTTAQPDSRPATRSSRRYFIDLLVAATSQHTQAARHADFHIDQPIDYCHRCGASAGPFAATDRGCAFCLNRTIAWDRTTRLGPYRHPLDHWIVQMKFIGQWTWARWFGHQLAQVVAASGPESQMVVCPVPMHWLRKWRRGYNQAEQIARAVAADQPWPLANLLRRTRHTPPQTSVPPSRRFDNVRGSFDARALDLTGWHVLLVDDVKTTGATANVAARLLKRAGAASVHLAVVAVADPPHSQTQHKPSMPPHPPST